jgi:methionyl-tRNA formyltransferase
MVERVDAGPIVGVDLFDVPSNADVAGLEQMAFARVARLLWNLAKPLATQRNQLPELPVRWCGSKSTQRMLSALCDIPVDISKDELESRIRAFGAGVFGRVPTVTLHGQQFRYIGSEPDVKIDAPGIVPDLQAARENAS